MTSMNEEGVSEIIGAILLVSLAVIGVALVAVVLFSQPAPTEIPQVSIVAGTTAGNTSFVLLNEGGDALEEGSYRIYMDTGTGLVDRTGDFSLAGDDVWSIGENLTYDGADVAQITRVIVATVDSGGGETVIAASGYSTGTADAGGYADEGGAGTGPSTSALAPNFVANVTNGTIPLAVQFLGVSTGSPTTWDWDFGDGTTATGQNITSHTYTAAGTYTVSLTVSNGTYSETETKTGYITASSPTTWYDAYLNTDYPKSGFLRAGGYLEFTVTGAHSYVTIKKNNKYPLSIGDVVRLTLGSDGYGMIYIYGGAISTFSYDDVSLSVNGAPIQTGTVQKIWISDSDDLSSTLTLQVPPEYDSTVFSWDGEYKSSGYVVCGIVLDNLKPASNGILNLDNSWSSYPEVYFTGSASDYTFYGW